MAADSTSGPKSLKEYLKRYESNGQEELKKKKRKKKVESKPDARGVLVVDEDPVWQKPVNLEEENEESAGKMSSCSVCVIWFAILC
jgi:pre-mRNA-splicing factor CWC26